MPQVKGNGTLASNVLLAISGTTVAERLFAWDNMSVVEDLTVGSLAGTGVRPVCVDTDHKLVICTPACGNSFIETGAGEQCDDGNTNNGDGCSSTCQNEGGPICGNNIVEGAEECDDGNTDNGDGCSSVCMNEIYSGCNGATSAALDTCLYSVLPTSGIFGVCYVSTQAERTPEAANSSVALGINVRATVTGETDNNLGPCQRTGIAEFAPGALTATIDYISDSNDDNVWCTCEAGGNGSCSNFCSTFNGGPTLNVVPF